MAEKAWKIRARLQTAGSYPGWIKSATVESPAEAACDAAHPP